MTSHNKSEWSSTNAAGRNKVPLLYSIMGVSPSISERELRKHYYALSLQHHPDRHHRYNDSDNTQCNHNNSSSSSCELSNCSSRFNDITAAYHILSDPVKRAAYDTRHGVNFHSRANKLHEEITRHNTCAKARSELLSERTELEQETILTNNEQSEVPQVSKEEQEEEEEMRLSTELEKEQKWEEEESKEEDHEYLCTEHSNGNAVMCDGDKSHDTNDTQCSKTYHNSKDEDDDGDEDDEDYTPNECATSSSRMHDLSFVLLPMNASTSHTSHSNHPYYSQHTTLHPYTSNNNNLNRSEKFNINYNNFEHDTDGTKKMEMQQTKCSCLKTVTISRTTISKSWGLVFSHSNVLQGYNSCSIDGSTITGIPFPSIVLQVNDYNLCPGDDVCEIIERFTQSTNNNNNNNNEEESWFDSCNNNHESEVWGTYDKCKENASINELHLLLTYNLETYELRGNFSALILNHNETNLSNVDSTHECNYISNDEINYELLEQLIPRHHVAAELPFLLPGHSVMRINNMNVNNAKEFREALINIARQLDCNIHSTLSSSPNEQLKHSAQHCSNSELIENTAAINSRQQQQHHHHHLNNHRSFSALVQVASISTM